MHENGWDITKVVVGVGFPVESAGYGKIHSLSKIAIAAEDDRCAQGMIAGFAGSEFHRQPGTEGNTEDAGFDALG